MKNKMAAKRKRFRETDHDEDEEIHEQLAEPEKKTTNQLPKLPRNSRDNFPHKRHKQAEFLAGDHYRAKKAGGDIRVKGKLEPFAYLPLDPKQLNRRSRQKSIEKYKNIVAAAKKGSAESSGKVKYNKRTNRKKRRN